MSSWVDIVEATAAKIEAAQRVGSSSLTGKLLTAEMEHKMAGYFRTIQKTFPMAKVLALYKKKLPPEVKEASVEADFLLLFSEWLEGSDELLASIFTDSIANGNAAGFEGTLADWLDVFGIKPPENMDLQTFIPDSVIEKARKTAAARVKDVDQETIDRIAGQVADALENRSTSATLAKTIGETFTDMSKSRAKLIAQTELNMAINDGVKAANLEVGADEKEWLETYAAQRPRDSHIANMGDGRIPINDEFSGDGSTDAGSGNNNPFNCHCTTLYYGATEEAVAKMLGL